MEKIFRAKIFSNQTLLLLLLLSLLLLPTYWRMFQFGIYSMHDFHVFRLYEYDKCIADLQIPCRWAGDAAFEYGQPLFNFYAQLPYMFGEVWRVIGFSVIDSIKILFSLSLVLSAITMFFLSRQLWKSNLAALLSALIYVYAPYRAVDVYVRGALPESLAFILFPLITYFFNSFVLSKKIKYLYFFTLSFAALILTHNLSALMYLLFLSIWAIYFLTVNKAWNLLPKFVLSGVSVFGLVAFYVLPVIVESKLVTLGTTTEGYYDFRNHFVTLKQLLLSRYWGYGASLWGEDDRLSLALGYVQWIVPLLASLLILIQKSIKRNLKFWLLFLAGWGMLFLTHNKSTPLWVNFTPLAFVQFPWRFLGMAIFGFALSSGILLVLIKNLKVRLLIFITVLSMLVGLNTPFFFEDLWFRISDQEYFSGYQYKNQTASSVGDFWPKTASTTPTDLAPKDPSFISGQAEGSLQEKRNGNISYKLDVISDNLEVQFPVVYFPGWTAIANDSEINIYPSGELGLITTNLTKGSYKINLLFLDTNIRKVGNYITLVTLIIFVFSYIYFTKAKKHVS